MAVAYSSVGSSDGGASKTSLSWTHTVSSSESIVLAVIGGYDGFEISSSATFDGAAMTKVGYGYRCVVFAAANTTSATKTISVTLGTTATAICGSSIAFTGASSTVGTVVVNPAYSSNDGGAHSVTNTAASGGMLLFCTGQAYNSALPTHTNSTNRFWLNNGAGASTSAATQPGTGSAITMSTTSTGQWGSSVSVELVAGSAPSAHSGFFAMFELAGSSDGNVGGTLLAGVTYAQSNVYTSNTAADYTGMNNGSANGSSSTQTGMNPGSNYITANCGSLKYISKITIGYDYLSNLAGGWGVTYTEGLTVEASTDNSSWTSITTTPTYASTGSTDGLVDITIGGNYQYVRLSKASGYMCILEFQVWGS